MLESAYGMLSAMTERHNNLLQLAALDHERAVLRAEQRAVSAQLAEAAAVAALAEGRQAVLKRLKDQRARGSDLAWELEEVELQLRTLAAEGDPRDPLIAGELATLREQRAALEDKSLELLEVLETTLREQTELEAEWLRRSTAWAERAPSIRAEAERIAQRLAELAAAESALVAALDATDQALYHAASAQHDHALAVVADQTCGGCDTPLRAVELTALDRDQPARCSSCERLLVPGEQ